MTRYAIRLVMLCGLLFAVGAAFGQAPPAATGASAQADRFQAARELIRARMKEEKIPSTAISVAHRGEIVWEEGFGFADVANQTPATPHTVYRISSVSKVFTGTAIMILVEQGKIDLDRPMNEYLGEAKLIARVGSAEQATVRRLANHSSGLPAHDQYFFDGEEYRKTADDQMETLIARYGNIVWVPGERYEYSNLAMGVLTYAIERQSGMSFDEFIDKNIYQPLGMTRSYVGLSDEVRQVSAIPYVEGNPVPLGTNSTAGAGDLWSSSHDLIRFAMFNLKTRLPDQQAILRDESVHALQQAVDSEYGVGWGTDDNYRGTGFFAVGHHGGSPGWHSFLILIPSEQVAVAVVCNGPSHRYADAVSDSIISILVPEFGKRLEAAEAKRKSQPKPAPNPGRESLQPPAELLGEWSGTLHTYEGTMPVLFRFVEDGSAYAQLGDQPKTQLTRLDFRNNIVTADLEATILTTDTRRQLPGILEVDLTRRGDSMNGVIYANSMYGNPAWSGYRLNHWVELKKRPGDQ